MNCFKSGLIKEMKNFIRLFCLSICCLATGSYAQNAPQSIAGTIVSLETNVTLPIYAVNFNNISSCNLKLEYDPAIANATGVTIGPGMGGMISSNFTVPGTIILGWFTSGGITLPDSSVIFNIQFTKTGNGNSTIIWIDDGYSCEYNDGDFESLNDTPTANYYFNGSLVFQSPDAPITSIPDFAASPGSVVNIPVTVSNFQMIGALSLNLEYDPYVLTFLSFDNNSDFPGLSVDGSQLGIIQVEGFVPAGNTALTLQENTILFTLNFDYQDGYSALNWSDDGISCQYAGSLPVYPVLNDAPQSSFYINGSVSPNAIPAGAGPIEGPETVCTGSAGITYSVPVIAYASDYLWEVPEGVTIISGQNTNTLQVNFGNTPFTGIISVYGHNDFGNGSTSSIEISSVEQPAAAGQITGSQEVCQGQYGIAYSVEPITFASAYNWVLPAGCVITNGFNTNTIVVDFGSNASGGAIGVSGSNLCGQGDFSEPYQVTVNEIPEILIQPVSPPAIYAGSGSAQFILRASGSGLSYQWQEFVSVWNDLDESGLYVGVHSDSLTVLNPTVLMNGNRYRCIVSGVCSPSAVTDGNAGLTVLIPVGVSGNINQLSFLAYPNPCNQGITINYFTPAKGELTITLVNFCGEFIELISAGPVNNGMHSFKLDTFSLRSGLYSICLQLLTENNLMTHTQKFVCRH